MPDLPGGWHRRGVRPPPPPEMRCAFFVSHVLPLYMADDVRIESRRYELRTPYVACAMEVEQHERTPRGSRSTPVISPEGPLLRGAFEHHRASLVERLEAGEDGVALGRANARFLTVCFQGLFERAMRQAGLPSGIRALAAVGSFGRGAVALRSDADVVLIVDTEAVGAGEAAACAEALLHPLWDAGVAVDHQVLSCAEVVPLAEGYLETATAVLDLRLLAGDPELLRTLDARAYEGLFGEHRLGAFIDRLEAETTARHLRFGGSVYLLEPDVKNGAGALRDLDGMRWAARARYRIGHGTVGEVRNAWRELVELGVLVAPEAQQIAEAEEFLWRARNRLHLRAERKADRLAFEDQEALAVSMGYGDDRARAAERLMQAFYLYARTVTRARSSLLERLRPERRRTRPGVTTVLDGGVQTFDGKITIGGASEIQKDPAVAMRAFAVCVRQRAPMLPFARDIISGAAADAVWCERLRFDPEAADLFVDLVCTVPEVRAPRGFDRRRSSRSRPAARDGAGVPPGNGARASRRLPRVYRGRSLGGCGRSPSPACARGARSRIPPCVAARRRNRAPACALPRDPSARHR